MQSNKCICIEARGLLGSSHVAFHFLWSYEVKPRSINFDTLNSQGGNARRMKPRLDFLQPSLEKKYDRHFFATKSVLKPFQGHLKIVHELQVMNWQHTLPHCSKTSFFVPKFYSIWQKKWFFKDPKIVEFCPKNWSKVLSEMIFWTKIRLIK